MHEASIAESIVNTVLHHAQSNEAKQVKSIRIELGELTFLSEEQVRFWVEIGLRESIAKEAELEFVQVKGKLKCNGCGYHGPIRLNEDPLYHMRLPAFQCPQCEGLEIEITQGKDALIRNIRIEK